tara:strand:+ start:13719 stop:14681 length:963 start_codon:yes stop_codon:yes gene_type:complete
MVDSPVESIRKRFKKGEVSSVYLILGDDDHEKDSLIKEFESLVDEELRPFNVNRFNGGEVSLQVVIEAMLTPPMMSPRRIVVIVNAERIIQPVRESSALLENIDRFSEVIKELPPDVTLVISSGQLDQRRRLTKYLLKQTEVIRTGELKDIVAAQRWIQAKVSSVGKKMTVDAARMLSERIGPDINRLRDEVERLLLFVDDRSNISVKDVETVFGHAVVLDEWALTVAIERGDMSRALRELGLAMEQGAIPEIVLGQLGWVIRKRLPKTKVPSALAAMLKADRSLKRSTIEARVILERLVVQLCTELSVHGTVLTRRNSR